MIRGAVKSGIAFGLRWSGAGRVGRALVGRSGEPWIVGYHRVVEDFASSARTSVAATLISRAMLARHLDWIGRRFEFVSLDDIPACLERRATLRRPAAAVTFDDGYGDVYEHAFPLLKAKGIPAAVFVVTDLIGTPRIPLYDRLYMALVRGWRKWPSPPDALARVIAGPGIQGAALPVRRDAALDPLRALRLLLEGLEQPVLERLAGALESEVGVDERAMRERRPLTWGMLGEMRRSGITIGSHSRTHALLTREGADTVMREALGSRRELEKGLGAPVRHFAYPNGWFNAATIGMIEEAGYRCAFTSCRHRDPARPLYTLPRTLLWQRSSLGPLGGFSPSVMACQADGIFDRAALCPLDHWN